MHGTFTQSNYLIQFCFLVDPEIPRNITANQRRYSTNSCTAALAWEPPANLAEDDVYYKIQVYTNGTTIEYKENQTLTAYPLCSCGSHNVRVTVVNRCGHNASSPNVTVMLDQDTTLLPIISECNAPTIPPTSPQENTDDCGKTLL